MAKAKKAVNETLGEVHAQQERRGAIVPEAKQARLDAAKLAVADAAVAVKSARGFSAVVEARKKLATAQAELARAEEEASRPVNTYSAKDGGIKSSQGTLPAALVSIAVTAYSRDGVCNPANDCGLIPAAPGNWGILGNAGHKHGASPQAYALNLLIAIGGAVLAEAASGNVNAAKLAYEVTLDATAQVYLGKYDVFKGAGSRPQRADSAADEEKATAYKEGRKADVQGAIERSEEKFAAIRNAAFGGDAPHIPDDYADYLKKFFGVK